MSVYEQFKNNFMVELERLIPDIRLDYFDFIGRALDLTAYSYEISIKETSLIPAPDPIPLLVKTYIVVKKTEGLSEENVHAQHSKHIV